MNREIALTALPIVLAGFLIICLTLICPWRWVTALVQIPVWVALVWWQYAIREYYNLLDL